MSNDQWNNGQNNQWAPQQQPSASEWGQQGQASANEWQSAQQQGSANEWGQQQGDQAPQQGAEWGQQQSAGEWQQGQNASEWGQQADQSQQAQQPGWDQQGQQQGWDQQGQQQGWDQQGQQQQQNWDQQGQQQGWDQQQGQQQQNWDQQGQQQQNWDQQGQQQNWDQQQAQQWQGGAGYAAHGQQQSGGGVFNFDFSKFSLPKSATIVYIIGIAAIAGAWLFQLIGLFTGDITTPFGTVSADPSTLQVIQTLIVGALQAAFYILILRVALEAVVALIKIAEKQPEQ